MAAGISTYPFAKGFETDTVDVAPIDSPSPAGTWTVSGDGTALVSSDAAAAGSLSVRVNNATLSLNSGVVQTSGKKKVTVHMFCKPVPYDDNDGASKPVVSDCKAAFYISTSGKLWAWANDSWSLVKDPVTKDAWAGFEVNLDYDNGLWDLYYTNGVKVAGSGMTMLNTTPLTMSTKTTGDTTLFEQMNVMSRGAAYIDDVVIDSTTVALVGGTPSPATMDLIDENVVVKGLPILDAAKYFAPPNDTLAGPLGELFAKLFKHGEKIHVYFGDNVWEIYENTDLGWDPFGDKPASLAQITPKTGFWVEGKYAESVDVFRLIPHGALNTGGPITLEGGGKWNLLAWSLAQRDLNDSRGLGFSRPDTGDRLAIYDSGLKRYIFYDYLPGTGWMKGSKLATGVSLQPGQSFFFKSTSGGTYQ
jgi:hypothetical protein